MVASFDSGWKFTGSASASARSSTKVTAWSGSLIRAKAVTEPGVTPSAS